MFAYLNGILAEKQPSYAVIDCNGVGYLIEIPLSVFENLPEINSAVKLFTFFHTSDDGFRIFGFLNTAQKELFTKLISISKIGPKIGLSVLSTFDVEEFLTAVVQRNYKLIATVNGLGKKTAERLVLELKDKVDKMNIEPAAGQQPTIFADAQQALLTVGYSPKDTAWALKQLQKQNLTTTEEIIKNAMRLIGAK